MTAVRSHLTPDNVEGVKVGDTVYFHVTNIEQDWDIAHGFAVFGSNNAELLLMPGETSTLKFEAKSAGIFPFYCTDFCSALHQEMQGYLRISERGANTPLKWSTAAPPTPQETPKSEAKAEAPPVKTESKGFGPITEMKLEAIDPALAAKGKSFFEARCAACHKLDQRFVGPALNGVTLRRQPEWIMNMILNPSGMTQKDEVAKSLLETYATQMADLGATKEEARQILEYFRLNDTGAKK
jgi:mono/diheme cytochrome c family protein